MASCSSWFTRPATGPVCVSTSRRKKLAPWESGSNSRQSGLRPLWTVLPSARAAQARSKLATRFPTTTNATEACSELLSFKTRVSAVHGPYSTCSGLPLRDWIMPLAIITLRSRTWWQRGVKVVHPPLQFQPELGLKGEEAKEPPWSRAAHPRIGRGHHKNGVS
jgi:hypothetical protein